MVEYDGSLGRYIAIDEDAFVEDEPLDTWGENVLRNQEYFLHKNQRGCSMAFISGGTSSDDREKDRPITSFVWSDFLYIPYHIVPDLKGIRFDFHLRPASSVTGNTEALDVDLRVGLKGITSNQDTIVCESGTDYRHFTISLDLTSVGDSLETHTFLTASVRGYMTDVGQSSSFTIRSPGNVPHSVEDFEYESVGPQLSFAGDPTLGVPNDLAFEGKGIATSIEGNFTSCLVREGSNNMIVEKEPILLPSYLGSTAYVRNISYVQIRHMTITPIY